MKCHLTFFALFFAVTMNFISSSFEMRLRGTQIPCLRPTHRRPPLHTTKQRPHYATTQFTKPTTHFKRPSRRTAIPCIQYRPSYAPQTAPTQKSTVPNKPFTRHTAPNILSTRIPTTTEKQTTACKQTECVVGEWSVWTKCSSMCGGTGVKLRSRKVLKEPTCKGACPFGLRETRPCNRFCRNAGIPSDNFCKCSAGYGGRCCEKVCGNWSPWGKWDQCSTSCDSGIQRRLRTCSHPAPGHGGSDCAGPSYEIHECNHRICPVNGHWSRWGTWSPCSSTCGSGKKFRLRQCNNPYPSDEGKPCAGLFMVTAHCDLNECKNPGGRRGRAHFRKRRLLTYVNNDVINDFDVIVQRHNEQFSNHDDTMSVGPWTGWSICSATCGRGQRFRTRACQDLANPCTGVPMEVQQCNMAECLV